MDMDQQNLMAFQVKISLCTSLNFLSFLGTLLSLKQPRHNHMMGRPETLASKRFKAHLKNQNEIIRHRTAWNGSIQVKN